MSTYLVTVIRTGNSYALRVPKQYVEDAQLTLGQKALIGLPIAKPKQDRARIQELIRQLQEINSYSYIGNPVEWQRGIRKDRPLPGRA